MAADGERDNLLGKVRKRKNAWVRAEEMLAGRVDGGGQAGGDPLSNLRTRGQEGDPSSLPRKRKSWLTT